MITNVDEIDEQEVADPEEVGEEGDDTINRTNDEEEDVSAEEDVNLPVSI